MKQGKRKEGSGKEEGVIVSNAEPVRKEGPRRALVLVPDFTLHLTSCVTLGRWHNLSVGLSVLICK